MFHQMMQNNFGNDEEDTQHVSRGNYDDDEDDDEINNIESENLNELQQNPTVVIEELTCEEKLALANRSNEIYCQQLKYMKDHFESFRSLLEDKENIIENLMLRYDSGALRPDNSYIGNLNPDEINPYELKKKAEALAQRTIMENFDLREVINELTEDNFQLRAEIYACQEIINRQALYIGKLTKQEFNNNNNNNNNNNDQEQNQLQNADPANDPHAIAIRQARGQKHRKQQSSIQAPNIFGNNDNDDDENEDILNTNERENDNDNNNNNNDEKTRKKIKKQQNAHKSRQQSLTNADIFGTSNILDDNSSLIDPSQTEEAKKTRELRANKSRKESIITPNLFDDNNNNNKNYSQTEEAQKIRQQRAQKHHRKQSSAVAPAIFNEEEEESDNEQQQHQDEEQPSQAHKRRDSKQLDPRFSDEAVAKRQIRQEKHHRKQQSSLQAPNIFNNNNDEAQMIRDQRSKKHQQRKSSVVIPKDLFGNRDEEESDDNNNKQKKRRKSRIMMLSNAVGDKGHFSDEEDKDIHRIPITKTTKSKAKKGHKKLLSMSEQNGKKAIEHHKRKSSVPIPDLGLDDPTIQLEWNQEEIKSLQTKLDNVQNDLKSATQALQFAVQSKNKIAESTAMQIDRLTRVLNTLLGIEQYREIVKLLLKESINWQ